MKTEQSMHEIHGCRRLVVSRARFIDVLAPHGRARSAPAGEAAPTSLAAAGRLPRFPASSSGRSRAGRRSARRAGRAYRYTGGTITAVDSIR
jgi:hypothetical protein